MIALTKKKREELANYAKERLASHVIHGGCSDEEDIFKIALASLTAEEVNQVIFNNHLDDGYVEWADCNKDYFNRNPSDYRRVLYTAPPVPEIKLPPEFNESHDSFNEFRRGWNGAISEFKRTNGLGIDGRELRLEYLSRSTVTAGILVEEMQSICIELLKLRNQILPPEGYALVPIEPTENMIIAGFESKPSAFNSSLEEVERCEAKSGCEQAGHNARLCWKAMIDEASKVKLAED